MFIHDHSNIKEVRHKINHSKFLIFLASHEEHQKYEFLQKKFMSKAPLDQN